MFWRKKEKEISSNFFKENREFGAKEFLLVINHLVDGLLVFDKKNRLSLINPKAEEFFRVKKEDVLGKHILELNKFPYFAPLVYFLGGGIKESNGEEVKIKENFILKVFSISMRLKGEKIGTLIILHNISREKLIEKMKSEFVTVAAHQLRTPTSGMKWCFKMLLDGDLGELSPEQKEAIKKAYIANDKVIKLVTNLLNVASIEEGKYLSKPTLSSLEDLFLPIIDDYETIIKKKDLKIVVKKPKEKLPKVMVDAEKIKIAFRNLLDNAIKYTPEKGKIIISMEGGKEKVKIQIKDNGMGIPEKEQVKVFSKFFRGENALKTETEGTGLGLYIAKNIVEAHGGEIGFESKEGKGSVFYFTLPVKKKFGEFLTSEFY